MDLYAEFCKAIGPFVTESERWKFDETEGAEETGTDQSCPGSPFQLLRKLRFDCR